MGLRVLSWNVQMRSWAMQVGASPGYTIPPIDTGEERARIIAKKLIASPWVTTSSVSARSSTRTAETFSATSSRHASRTRSSNATTRR